MGDEYVELYENVGLFSLVIFSWLDGILRVGWRKFLEFGDMFLLLIEDSMEVMY